MKNEFVNQVATKPTQLQMAYQDLEMGIFFHFGLQTFYEDYKSGMPISPEKFNPTDLNCGSWIDAAQEAGMKYAVLVCKHIEGFTNWQSKYSQCGVAQSSWKNGTGDVVREFTDACQQRKMKVGLYFPNPKCSNDEYQLFELLQNYGRIDILWVDGNTLPSQTIDDIRLFQPDILIFENHHGPDFRWVGNEAGIAPLPNWNTEGSYWLPVECDCTMRWNNWFYKVADVKTVKPLQELMGLYYLSVGRGANLLLNIGPDRRGHLPDADCARLKEFGAEITRRFGNPVVAATDVNLSFNSMEQCMELEYDPGEPFYLDHVVLQEDLKDGEKVQRFRIIITTTKHDNKISIYEGQNIGHKAICSFPLVACLGVKVQITEPYSSVDHLRSVSLYNTSGLVHQH